MRATLNIPDKLLAEVQKAAKKSSKTEAIVTAMEEFVRRRKIEALLALKGKIDIGDPTKDLEAREIAEMKSDELRRRRR